MRPRRPLRPVDQRLVVQRPRGLPRPVDLRPEDLPRPVDLRPEDPPRPSGDRLKHARTPHA